MQYQQTESERGEVAQHSEGRVARAIEEQTAKLPSDTFLWAAVGSMAVAAFLQLTERRHASLFVGQWAAPLLLFGIYNKLVKIGGSDRLHRADRPAPSSPSVLG